MMRDPPLCFELVSAPETSPYATSWHLCCPLGLRLQITSMPSFPLGPDACFAAWMQNAMPSQASHVKKRAPREIAKHSAFQSWSRTGRPKSKTHVI